MLDWEQLLLRRAAGWVKSRGTDAEAGHVELLARSAQKYADRLRGRAVSLILNDGAALRRELAEIGRRGSEEEDCPTCNGMGECPDCDGTGQVPQPVSADFYGTTS